MICHSPAFHSSLTGVQGVAVCVRVRSVVICAMALSDPFTEFTRARDLLLHTSGDHDATYAAFRWPNLDAFNWMTHWFDELAAGNRREALRIVSDSGVERVTFDEMAER